jgi:hypothetical protein
MLQGRQGFWPFVLAWAVIVACLSIVLFAILWFGGSLPH